MNSQRGLDHSQGYDPPRVRVTSQVVARMSWATEEGERKTLEGLIWLGRMVYYPFVVSVQERRWGSPPSRTQVQC